jgi:hypothetical protein
MYEIWLALNIVWEIALGIWPFLVGALLLWIALMTAALRRPASRWRPGLPVALVAGFVMMIVVVLALPSLTRSSLSEMGYWVDWANLLAIAGGFGAVVAAFVWPVAAMRAGA